MADKKRPLIRIWSLDDNEDQYQVDVDRLQITQEKATEIMDFIVNIRKEQYSKSEQ